MSYIKEYLTTVICMSEKNNFVLYNNEKLFKEATDILKLILRKHKDWFNENNIKIQNLLKKKNRAHMNCVINSSSTALR